MNIYRKYELGFVAYHGKIVHYLKHNVFKLVFKVYGKVKLYELFSNLHEIISDDNFEVLRLSLSEGQQIKDKLVTIDYEGLLHQQ